MDRGWAWTVRPHIRWMETITALPNDPRASSLAIGRLKPSERVDVISNDAIVAT